MFLRFVSANLRDSVSLNNALVNAFPGIRTGSIRKFVISRYSLSKRSTDETILKLPNQNGTNNDINKNEQFSQKEIEMLNQVPDSFGTLSSFKYMPSPKESFDKVDLTEAVEKKITRKIRSSKVKSIDEYESLLNQMIEQQNVIQACEYFEEQMLKKDKFLPPVNMYELLINECLRHEFVTKAFDIYEHMVNRRLKISYPIIERLILAYESSKLTFRKVHSLCKLMTKFDYKPNEKIENALIRINIRSGQWSNGFKLYDEMVSHNFQPELDTITAMIEGCSHDKNDGFYRMLDLWHEIERLGYIPNNNTYVAFLKAVTRCEINDINKLNETLKLIKEKSQINLDTNLTESKEETVIDDGRPNLLHVPPKIGKLFPLKNAKNPVERLVILGGTIEFLNKIKKFNIKPTSETIVALLNVIPNTFYGQQKIISLLNKHKIIPNFEVFNILLRNSCMRQNFTDAKEVIELMYTYDVDVDITCYGILSLSCKSAKDSVEFFNYTESNQIMLNNEIFNAMLKNACNAKDNDFVINILRKMESKEIEPLEESIKMIEEYQRQAYHSLTSQREHNQKSRNAVFKLIREQKDFMRHFHLDNTRKKSLINAPKNTVNRINKTNTE